MSKEKFDSIYKDEPQKSTGLLFVKAYNKWHGIIKQALAYSGLTHPQFVVLCAAASLAREQEQVTQVMIAEFSDMDMMTVSQILKLLEKKNFIKRAIHPQDSRAKTVRITKIGREKINKALPVVEDVDVKFFSKLGNQKQIFNEFLLILESD